LSQDTDNHQPGGLKQTIGLITGPVAAVVLLVFTPEPSHPEVARTAAVAVLMAIWWITEAIPIPATALLPVALLPLLGVTSGTKVAAAYFNHIIFLFIGGFLMALAMQRWDLHRRIALRIILLVGSSPRRLLLGFMTASAFLSMWISNTATTMMMVPIALAIIFRLKETAGGSLGRFPAGLLIGIAYASSIGGMATLIGTPPNQAFTQIFHIYFPEAPEITFAGWFLFGLPCSVIFLAAAWLLLAGLFLPRGFGTSGNRKLFREEYARLGRMSFEERTVLTLFVMLAVLWLLRADIEIGLFVIPGWSSLLPVPDFVDDGTIAIFVGLALFVIPSRSRPGERLLDWRTANKLHWGIVLLFGGGFALAAAFKDSGLSAWLTGQLTGLQGAPPVVLVASICTLMTFLTELTSNTATTQMALPLLGSLALAIEVNPLLLMIPATLSASCAFMLPVATPPNAIVFGSGEVRMADMMKAGLILNLIGVVLITTLVYLLGLIVFGIDPDVIPDWAISP